MQTFESFQFSWVFVLGFINKRERESCVIVSYFY